MKKIFTFLVAFLAVASGAVWGQDQDPVKRNGLIVSGPTDSFWFNSDEFLQIRGDGVTISNENPAEAVDVKISIYMTDPDDDTPKPPCTVILDGVYLRPTQLTARPISMRSGTDVTLILKGKNRIETLEGHEYSSDGGLDDAMIHAGEKANLTIKEDESGGELELINNGVFTNAIGGKEVNTTIESGTIKIKQGSIGGTTAKVTIRENAKIEIEQAERGFSAPELEIDGANIKMINTGIGIWSQKPSIKNANINIQYTDEYRFDEITNGKGISLSIEDTPLDKTIALNMYSTILSITDGRIEKKAVGIEGTNKNNATISDCDIDMDVATGLYSVADGIVSIKGNSYVNINATENAIDISKKIRSTIDISEESVVLLSSNGENAAGIYVGYMGNMTTGENGNAYVVADTKEGIVYKELIGEDKDKLKDTDRSAWKGIVFERDENLDGILSGYVYGDITMQTDKFVLEDNYHLIYCLPGKLTIDKTKGKLVNRGDVFVAYESEDDNIEEQITSESGKYHYEVFYDEETLNVPADLIPEGKTIADIIQSEQLMTKKNHPNSEDKEGTMLFGQSEDDITLSIDNSDYTFTFKVKPMNSESTKEILVEGNTFTMPAEAVLVYDITIEKKVEKYIAKVDEGITGGTVTIGEGVQEAEFEEGATVGVNIDPADGYVLDEVFYVGNGEKTPITEIDRFTMPAYDVIIYVTFKESQGGDDEGDDDSTSGAYKKRFRLYLANEDYFPKDCEEDYELEGLVLFSRHDKKYTHAGGSFTIWYEQFGEPNVGNYRVFWSKTAKGEYEEVKFDEVSEYFQIRDVHSNVFVKLYYETGFPVSNETIEATEARAYAQPNKIVVITPEPTEVQIISMAGAVVATAQVAGQQEFANLTEGVYIVRMGEDIVKLQVRN